MDCVFGAQVALEGEADAAMQAIARTAKHRLERGIWTSPGAGLPPLNSPLLLTLTFTVTLVLTLPLTIRLTVRLALTLPLTLSLTYNQTCTHKQVVGPFLVCGACVLNTHTHIPDNPILGAYQPALPY